ncbi:MAG: ABC transporter ATP-binding protein [Candidatus Dormibacteria bacterium]
MTALEAPSPKPSSLPGRVLGWGGWSLLRALPGLDPGYSAAILVTSILLVAAPLARTIVTGLLVGAVPAALGHGLASLGGHRLVSLVAVMGTVFVAGQVLGPVHTLVRHRLQHNVDVALRQRLLVATTSPPGLAMVEDSEFQDQVGLTKGVGAVEATPGRAAVSIAAVATRMATAVGGALMLAAFHWWLALAMFAFYAYLYARLRSSIRAASDVFVDESEEMRRATYLRELATTPPAAKEIRVFGLADWVLSRQRESWLRGISEAWVARSRGLPATLWLMVVAGLASCAAFLLLGDAALHGQVSTTGLVIYASGALQMLSIITVNDDDMAVEYGMAALPALREVEARSRQATPRAGGRRDVDGLPAREIRFEDVAFRYSGSSRDVYSGLDLTIRAGQSLAIVGLNGAGKTTLVKLLARLYEPVSGRITVDGIDLRDLDAWAWQRHVAAVFQDFVRFPFSARENVEVGGERRRGDRELLARVSLEAGLEEVVAGLPRGWDTVLSREFEDGADLSGGEWQRVAVARALFGLDAGAGVLVLDEPTANLDVRSEAAIFDRLVDFTRGQTTILISHRFSTVRRADRICVLSGGRIVEDGTHGELLALGGEYATLFNLQARQFTGELDAEDREVLIDV